MQKRGNFVTDHLGSIILMAAIVVVLVLIIGPFFKKASGQTNDAITNTCIAVGRCEYKDNAPAGERYGCDGDAGYEQAPAEYKCPSIKQNDDTFDRICCIKTPNRKEVTPEPTTQTATVS
jgi:hypothetical protein